MSHTIGQVVGIVRNGSWGVVPQSKYVVTKVNKVRIELARVGDNYVRNFSVKTGAELGNYTGRTQIISEASFDKLIAQKSLEQARAQSVSNIVSAANNLRPSHCISPEQIASLRALLDEAEKLATV